MPVPSPRVIKALAEALGESYKGAAAKGSEIVGDLTRALTENPQLAELLSTAKGKIGKGLAGMSDALQEAIASSLEGRQAPELLEQARKARAIALGQHITERTGTPVGATQEAERLSKPELGPRITEAGRMLTQVMTPPEAAIARKYALDPNSLTHNEQYLLSQVRQKIAKLLGKPDPTITPSPLPSLIDPSTVTRFSPEEGGSLKPPEAISEAYEQIMPTVPRQKIPWTPGREGGPVPRSYAQILPKEPMEIRPGPLKPLPGGITTIPQKTYDPNAPAPKIEMSPEEMFQSPEVQQLYRRIILGQE